MPKLSEPRVLLSSLTSNVQLLTWVNTKHASPSSSLLIPGPWCPWEVALFQEAAGAALSAKEGEPEPEDHNKADRGCFLIDKACIPTVAQQVERSRSSDNDQGQP